MTAAPEGPSRNARPARLTLFCSAVVLAWMLVVTLPGSWSPLGPPGMDGGWRWGVNQAAATGKIFGRDLVFTYGPLGFLVEPVDLDGNLVAANLFLLFTQLLLGAALVALLPRRPLAVGVAAFLLALATVHDLTTEGRLVLVTAILALTGLELSAVWLAVAALLAALLVWVKLSLGLAAAGAVMTAVVLRGGKLGRAGAAAAFAGGFTAVGLLLVGGPAAIGLWLARSWEVVSGYAVAMSQEGAWYEPAFGATLVVAWAVVALATLRRERTPAPTVLLLPLLLTFRLSFVRQGHALHFFGFLLGALAVDAAWSTTRRGLVRHLSAFAAVLLVGAAVVGRGPRSELARVGDLALGRPGLAAAAALARPGAIRANLAAASTEVLAPLRLPPSWLAPLRRSPNGVAVLPWELLYCPANGLPWRPMPSLQLYAGYTRRLDLANATALAGPGAPTHVLEHYPREGKWHAMLGSPATWWTLYTNYRLADADPDRGLLLLARRAQPLRFDQTRLGEALLDPLGRGVAVPPSRYPLLADLDLELGPVGTIQKLLFRVPPVYLVFEHASGRSTAFRAIPGVSGHGVLVNCFPADLGGYLGLWQGECRDPVVGLLLGGPGAVYLRSPVRVSWREMRPAG